MPKYKVNIEVLSVKKGTNYTGRKPAENLETFCYMYSRVLQMSHGSTLKILAHFLTFPIMSSYRASPRDC